MTKTSSGLFFTVAMLGLGPTAEASITSWSNEHMVHSSSYYADFFSTATLHDNNPGWVAGGNVYDYDPWTQYFYDGSGYAASGAFATSNVNANTSTYFDLTGRVSAQTSAEQYSLDGRRYIAYADANEHLTFTLDNVGTLNATLSNYSSYVGGSANHDISMYIDGNYYAGSTSVGLGAGSHSVYIFDNAHSVAGTYGNPPVLNYGVGSFGYGGTDFEFQIESNAVPEPCSLVLLGLGLLRVGRKSRLKSGLRTGY